MYEMILTLSMATAGGVPESPPADNGCAGAKTQYVVVEAGGCAGRPQGGGCTGKTQSSGCHGTARHAPIFRSRAVAVVAAPAPAVAKVAAPVASVATVPAPVPAVTVKTEVVVPATLPQAMTGGNSYAVPLADRRPFLEPVRIVAGGVVDRTRGLLGRVFGPLRSSCAGGNCPGR